MILEKTQLNSRVNEFQESGVASYHGCVLVVSLCAYAQQGMCLVALVFVFMTMMMMMMMMTEYCSKVQAVKWSVKYTGKGLMIKIKVTGKKIRKTESQETRG